MIEMRIIQIIGLIAGIYLLYKSYRSFKQEEGEDVNSFLLWFVLGILITVVSADLRILNFASGLLRMEQNPNTVFTISTLILFVIGFKLYARLERLDRKISKLNEAVSIEKYKKQGED